MGGTLRYNKAMKSKPFEKIAADFGVKEPRTFHKAENAVAGPEPQAEKNTQRRITRKLTLTGKMPGKSVAGKRL